MNSCLCKMANTHWKLLDLTFNLESCTNNCFSIILLIFFFFFVEMMMIYSLIEMCYLNLVVYFHSFQFTVNQQIQFKKEQKKKNAIAIECIRTSH